VDETGQPAEGGHYFRFTDRPVGVKHLIGRLGSSTFRLSAAAGLDHANLEQARNRGKEIDCPKIGQWCAALGQSAKGSGTCLCVASGSDQTKLETGHDENQEGRSNDNEGS
jgi:hypothetical protein